MEQKKITINETEYTLQKVYPIEWAKVRDRIKNRYGIPSEEKLMKEVLKHIVIDPKVQPEDFGDWGELNELVQEAVRFQQGSLET